MSVKHIRLAVVWALHYGTVVVICTLLIMVNASLNCLTVRCYTIVVYSGEFFKVKKVTKKQHDGMRSTSRENQICKALFC